MSKSIVRTIKNKNFTTIDNRGMRDKNLSWKAKGLLAYCLTLPDDWKFYIEDLAKRSTDKYSSTAAAVKELIKKGYITRSRRKGEHGHFDGYEYRVIETGAISPSAENPCTDNPCTENQ